MNKPPAPGGSWKCSHCTYINHTTPVHDPETESHKGAPRRHVVAVHVDAHGAVRLVAFSRPARHVAGFCEICEGVTNLYAQ